MKNNHRVIWSKGMFLTPQHFQTQDQFVQQALQSRFTGSCFANWGVTQLEIDRDSLQNGTFRLMRCAGLMPDGESFQMPETDQLPDSRAILKHFPETQRTLDVYLALPERRIQGSNITIPVAAQPPSTQHQEDRPNTRYIAETQNVSDENRGEEMMAVEVALRNFRVLFGDEVRDGFTSLRIAQVTRNSAGIPILKEDFVAPCLNLAHSEYLMRVLRRQIEILANKCATLSGARRASRRKRGGLQRFGDGQLLAAPHGQ